MSVVFTRVHLEPAIGISLTREVIHKWLCFLLLSHSRSPIARKLNAPQILRGPGDAPEAYYKTNVEEGSVLHIEGPR